VATAAKRPLFPVEDIYRLLPMEPETGRTRLNRSWRGLVDGSEHMEFRPGYGPEVYTGLCKMDGFLAGLYRQPPGVPQAGTTPNMPTIPAFGGKLYRQGLIKMNEFVTLCGRDRIPIVWFQDTTGIDVGDAAEKAELLGLGQSLIYSIQQTDVPMMLVVLRKGTAAAHYVMGGPTANRHNAFTLGTAATEIYVMHGETAAVATYARRLVKEKAAGRPLAPIMVDKMNELAQAYHDKSRPLFCARKPAWWTKSCNLDQITQLPDGLCRGVPTRTPHPSAPITR
jgi:glutaconyl-CoA decarboxylase